MGNWQWLVVSGQWSVVRVKFGVWRVELSHRGDWVRIAVRSAASAPSEEGAGAPKGFGGATEGERMRGYCLHQGVGVHKVIQISLCLCARLYLLLSHILGVSLLPSRRFKSLYAVPPPSSEGGEGAPVPRHRFNCSGKVCKSALPFKMCRHGRHS